MSLQKEDIAAHFTRQFAASAGWIVRGPAGSTSSANTPITTTASSCRWPSTGPSGSPCGRATTAAWWSTRSTTTSRRVLPGRPVPQKAGWIEYIKGVAWSLQDAGYGLVGWEGVMAGDVPLGAGLSSSAAVEMATARALAAAGNLPWDPAAMAKLGQRAENKWIGVNCGIMDQMISAAGKAGHAMLLDCRSLETQPAPLPPAWPSWCWTPQRAADWSIRPTTSGAGSAKRRRSSSASRPCAT